MTSSFKFEIWPVKDYNEDEPHAFVVTRSIQDGEDNDGQPIVRSFSKVHSTAQLAFQELRVSLDNLQKLYKTSDQPKR